MSFETAMVLEKEKAELLQVIEEKDKEIARLKKEKAAPPKKK